MNNLHASVIVKEGGILAAYNASFTNICVTNCLPWKGIAVRGNTSYPYYDFEYQGFLVLENCLIKGTYRAVVTDKGHNTNIGGGTVLIKNTVFQDNSTSIRLGESPLGYSQITGCSFIRTTAFPEYLWQTFQNFVPNAIIVYPTHAYISNCEFTATYEGELDQWDMPAISAYGGKIKVSNCEFHNYGTGVIGQSFSPTDILEIKDNYINCRNQGVSLARQTNSVIVRNEIHLRENGRGAFFDESTNFTFEENNIHTNGEWYDEERGLEILSTGLYNNLIYKNTFNDLWIGMMALYNLVDNNHGLVFKCNKFTNSRWDFWVGQGEQNEGIFKYQGSGANTHDAGAGNQFSHIGYSFSDFQNLSQQHISYFYHANGGTNFEPLNYTEWSITAVPNTNPEQAYIEEESCPSHLTSPGSGSISIDTSGLATRMRNGINGFNEINALIAQLKDGGNTNELINNIAGSIPPEAYEVYIGLMQKSPYLSNEAILAAINKEEVLNNASIRDVMVANPQSAKEDELLNAVDARATSMSDEMKAEIWSGLDITSALENLESIKAYYAQQADKSHCLLIQYYMADTTDQAGSKQALTELLEMGIKPESYYQLAFMYLEDGDNTTSEQLLNNVPNAFELNSFQNEEFITMRAYFNIIKEMHQNDEFISTLNESQLASLLDIAENGQGIARGYARNILVQYGLWADPLMQEDNLKYSFAENVDLPPKAGEYTRLKNLIKGYKDNIITLYPNPTKDYLIVEFTFEGLSNNVKLQILSADGKTVKQLDIADNDKKAVIYVGGFASGVYTLALFNGNKMLSHEKFNIIK